MYKIFTGCLSLFVVIKRALSSDNVLLCFWCARQGALTRRCKTAAGLIGGTASHNRKGVRREAESEGSERQTTGSTNRKHIEADMLGEKANRFKAQYLSGKHRRRCDGHKWESKCAIPGEVCPVSTQFFAEEAGTD